MQEKNDTNGLSVITVILISVVTFIVMFLIVNIYQRVSIANKINRKLKQNNINAEVEWTGNVIIGGKSYFVNDDGNLEEVSTGYIPKLDSLGRALLANKNSTDEENIEETESYYNSGMPGEIDIKKSILKWRGWKIISSGEHTGTVKISEGRLNIENDKIVSGFFLIDMNSIKNTDLTDTDYQEKLVGHLMSEDFFNVAKFPTGRFKIVSVEEKTSGGYTHEVSGNLTLRDITRKITFPATIKIEGNNITATGKATINRLEWGINYDSKNLNLAEAAQNKIKDGIVSKEMEITISLKATK